MTFLGSHVHPFSAGWCRGMRKPGAAEDVMKFVPPHLFKKITSSKATSKHF